MKRLHKNLFVLLMLFLTLCMVRMPAQAKVTNAPAYKLVNVARAPKVKGKWIQKPRGVEFKLEDGTFVHDQWIRVGNKIYYMNRKAVRAIGWIKYRTGTYYTNSKGELQRGWQKINNKVYYMKPNGKAAGGLHKIGNYTFYFSTTNGVRQNGWVQIGKDMYYFAPVSGKMRISKWICTDGKYYYVDEKGRKLTSQWLTLGQNQYYLGEDGARVTGEVFLGDEGYFFRENGVYDPSVKVRRKPDPSKPMVALTFDDGPGLYTNRLLDCLERNDARATFFMVGTNVPRYSSAVQRMVDLGCELGNHSYNHSYFTSLSYDSRRYQVTTTSNAIYNACGQYPTLFRLPYGDGHSNSSVLNSLGLPSIYWSIDTRDWANTGNPQSTVNAVLNYVRSGDIVLMHDIHRSTVTAAETIIPELVRRGYQLVTVSELAKYKGNTELQTGKTYYSFR